jgi:hypothetical protein
MILYSFQKALLKPSASSPPQQRIGSATARWRSKNFASGMDGGNLPIRAPNEPHVPDESGEQSESADFVS